MLPQKILSAEKTLKYEIRVSQRDFETTLVKIHKPNCNKKTTDRTEMGDDKQGDNNIESCKTIPTDKQNQKTE